MNRWLFRRAASAVGTFLLACTLLFFLMRLTPGDPLLRLSEDRPMTPEALANLRAHYGLDQPVMTQFVVFLGGVLRGDLGASIEHGGRPVVSLLRERLPASLLLGATTLLFNFMLGIAIGSWQARHIGRRLERWVDLAGLATASAPSFWVAIVLAWAFGTELHWLPVAFMHDPLLSTDAGRLAHILDDLDHLVLPAATLAIVTVGVTARYQRAAMLDALRMDPIRTARAKGLPESRVRWRHAWPNTLGPMLALFGLWLPIVVSGSVFVESVYSWPGLGTLAAEALASRDYPVLMGTAVLIAATVVAANFFADLAHRWIDPRLRNS